MGGVAALRPSHPKPPPTPPTYCPHLLPPPTPPTSLARDELTHSAVLGCGACISPPRPAPWPVHHTCTIRAPYVHHAPSWRPPIRTRARTQVGHFNWKRAPREWMVRLCSQPHLPGGRATIWLCGHYHASCTGRTRAGTEVVTTGAAGGVINWSKPPQAIAISPATNPSLARLPPPSSLLRRTGFLVRAPSLRTIACLPPPTGARHAARLPVHGVRQPTARHLRRLQLGPASMPRPTGPDRPPLPRAQRCTAQLG